MSNKPIPDGLRKEFHDRIVFADQWWQNAESEGHQLPGEENLNTVFVIDFYDGCRYFGYTNESVTYRVASLAFHLGSWGTTSFVENHARRVPYVVRCIASNLEDRDAKEVRDLMAARAPENFTHAYGTTVQSPDCWLLRY